MFFNIKSQLFFLNSLNNNYLIKVNIEHDNILPLYKFLTNNKEQLSIDSSSCEGIFTFDETIGDNDNNDDVKYIYNYIKQCNYIYGWSNTNESKIVWLQNTCPVLNANPIEILDIIKNLFTSLNFLQSKQYILENHKTKWIWQQNNIFKLNVDSLIPLTVENNYLIKKNIEWLIDEIFSLNFDNFPQMYDYGIIEYNDGGDDDNNDNNIKRVEIVYFINTKTHTLEYCKKPKYNSIEEFKNDLKILLSNTSSSSNNDYFINIGKTLFNLSKNLQCSLLKSFNID